VRFVDSVTRAVGEAEVMGAATKEGYIFISPTEDILDHLLF
jgi:hypothetical protein